MRKSPRQRRLEADYRSVEKLSSESTIFGFQAKGDPPNRYRLQFDGPGICRDSRGKIQITNRHEVIVELGASYPRMVPNLLWQTPVFHPNISNNGVVCLGGYGTHWVPSLTLDEMSTMLWDMIRFENFDIQSPYNREAALWARDQKHFKFPLDKRDIRDRVVNPQVKSAPFQTSSSSPASPKPEKGVFGMIGAFANRIRERRERTEASAERVVAVVEGEAESPSKEVLVEAITSIDDDSATEISGDANRSEHVSESLAVECVDSVNDCEQAVIPVEVVESDVAESVPAEASEIEIVEASDLVDPSEIEIIEDGITFLDSHDSSNNVAVNSQSRRTPTLADDDGSGIVFLD